MLSACSTTCTTRAASILRLISLAILFGGSAAVVFSAITLVKAAEAQGIPTAQAAAANAPVFIHFSKVALGASIALLVAEALDFSRRKRPEKLVLFRYVVSLLCVATTMIFALGIVPPMAELLPLLHSKSGISPEDLARAHADFQKLHELSRMVFGGTIVLALISLVLPTFGSQPATPAFDPTQVTLDG